VAANAGGMAGAAAPLRTMHTRAGPTPPTRPAADRPHQRGARGGVRPGRAHPGHRHSDTVLLWDLADRVDRDAGL